MTHRPVVLVLENDRQVAEVTVELLEGDGFDACYAPTLSAANAFIRQRIPDVVLIDLMLNDGSGADFAQRARALYGEQIRLIGVTGWGGTDNRVVKLASLCDLWFPKPVVWPDLINAMRQLLKNS